MKIRRLEILGFKSFADRTVFEFGDGISSIVGPNGCGKSNVVDAVKWVLGDMSPRSLRGKRMEDVIFAGSRHRRAHGLAEVSLFLDNSDGSLPSERTEIQITRRLHRSGESEYLVGGEAARLKDIRELFLDTGLGVERNAIMEQGQIDALLAANPADRRGIFEEAAGISRYKQRKKEAEQRLERTRENLERLLDVLELEEKRLRSLKNQAGRARRYQELRDELQKKRVLRGVLRYRRVASEREALSGRMAGALEEERRAAEELQALEEATRLFEARRREASEAVHAREAEVAEAAADVRASRDRVVFATKTRDDLVSRIAASTDQAAAARTRAAALLGDVQDLDREAEAAAREAESLGARLASAEEDLVRLDAEVAGIRDAHEGAKKDALVALGRIADARNEEAERRVEVRQAEERLTRLGRQAEDLVLRRDRLESDLAGLREDAERLEAEGRARAERLAQAEREREARRAAALEARHRAAQASESRATKAARMDLLERLAAAHEGVDEGARRVLEAVDAAFPDADGARDGVFGILADLLRPGADEARVLDRLLGPAAGAIVVRSADDAARWIAWLRHEHGSARARFLALDLVQGDAPALPEGAAGTGGPAWLEPLVRSVAAGTRLVEDLAEGVRLWRTEGPTNAVTPNGDRVTASGSLLGGADGDALGLVGRTAERYRLRAEVERLDEELLLARGAATAAEVAVSDAEARIREIRHEIVRHAEDRHRGGESLARTEKELSHVLQGLETLDLEREDLFETLSFAHEAAAVVVRRLEVLEAERRALEVRADEAARGFAALESERRQAGERRMEIRLALAETKARGDGARARGARTHDEIRSLESRAAALETERADLEQRVGEAEVEIARFETLAARREADRRSAGEAAEREREALVALEGAAGGEAARRMEVGRLHEELRERLEELRRKDSELRVRMESLVEQVRQDQGLDLAAVAEETEAAETVDLDQVDAEVEDLRRRLEGLGNVNLNAIQELEEVETHVGFLRTQEKDLIDAKADLERVIVELDQVSTERFSKTFEEVREHFRETFRRLFGGGRADIVLDDASNVLESGVDVVARPPGKEQRTISLLSGGERTLTAVALLFAVFKARPSPFAILDEVDAALDEANVRRLVSLVREFTDKSQFLMVTHAKTTMEAADVLYGVTMEEPGVSKKVAVKLTAYDPAETVAAG